VGWKGQILSKKFEVFGISEQFKIKQVWERIPDLFQLIEIFEQLEIKLVRFLFGLLED